MQTNKNQIGEGFTKHYYVGSERICARNGCGHGREFIFGVPDGGSENIADSLYNTCSLLMSSRRLRMNDSKCIITSDSTANISINTNIKIPTISRLQAPISLKYFLLDIQKWKNYCFSEKEEYFYHSDHIGSASWITDTGGNPIQYIHYLPFGEQFVNQTISGYSERFTFSGKEKDSETGFSYFGARYYEPEMLNVWLSVDPMADKYPNLSPYNYCAWTRPTGGDEHRWIKYNIVNNPVKLVDPDERDWDPTTEEKYIKPYEAELISRIDYFNSINGRPLTEEEKSQFDECTASLNEISQLRDDPNTIYTINVGRKTSKTPYGSISYSGKSGNKDRVSINVFTQLNPDNVKNYFGTIAHELKHAFQFYSGILDLIILPSGKTVGTDTQELEKECFSREGMFDGVPLTNGGTIRNNYKLTHQSKGWI